METRSYRPPSPQPQTSSVPRSNNVYSGMTKPPLSPLNKANRQTCLSANRDRSSVPTLLENQTKRKVSPQASPSCRRSLTPSSSLKTFLPRSVSREDVSQGNHGKPTAHAEDGSRHLMEKSLDKLEACVEKMAGAHKTNTAVLMHIGDLVNKQEQRLEALENAQRTSNTSESTKSLARCPSNMNSVELLSRRLDQMFATLTERSKQDEARVQQLSIAVSKHVVVSEGLDAQLNSMSRCHEQRKNIENLLQKVLKELAEIPKLGARLETLEASASRRKVTAMQQAALKDGQMQRNSQVANSLGPREKPSSARILDACTPVAASPLPRLDAIFGEKLTAAAEKDANTLSHETVATLQCFKLALSEPNNPFSRQTSSTCPTLRSSSRTASPENSDDKSDNKSDDKSDERSDEKSDVNGSDGDSADPGAPEGDRKSVV